MRLGSSCAEVLATINGRIVELRDKAISGDSVRNDVINFEQRMRAHYFSSDCAPIRDVIEPFRFRCALTASCSFLRNWRTYESDREIVDDWPYGWLRVDSSPSRMDEIAMRWQLAGGLFVGEDRRMMAKRDSPAWSKFSLFGLPYPPFDQYLDIALSPLELDEARSLRLSGKVSPPPSLTEPAALTIDSDVVTLITNANRNTYSRVSHF